MSRLMQRVNGALRNGHMLSLKKHNQKHTLRVAVVRTQQKMESRPQ